MTEILENELFLGDIGDAHNDVFLQNHNISAIICVADHVIINNNNPNITIYHYDLADDSDCNISCYFDEIFKVIEKHDNVLVHCVAGISRSPTIIIAYLMKYFRLSLKDAFIEVLNKRRIICPNKNFMNQLFKYEFDIFAKNSLTYQECIDLFYYS